MAADVVLIMETFAMLHVFKRIDLCFWTFELSFLYYGALYLLSVTASRPDTDDHC